MAEHDFEAALRDADRVWSEESASPRVERQLRRRLRGEVEELADPKPTHWWRFGAIVAVAALLVLWLSQDDAASTQVAGFAVPKTCGAHAEGPSLVVEGDCALVTPRTGITVEVSGAAQISATDDGVAVTRGSMTFDVEPRARRRRIAVSGGVIEILGTRFEVQESGSSGSVHLVHGSIRFVGTDGRTVLMKPGESLRWPLEPEADATAAPPAPTEVTPSEQPSEEPAEPTTEPAPVPSELPSATATTAPSAALPPRPRDLMAEIAKLRSQGRFEEAAELLREVGPLPAEDRERLSYERGAMLTYRLDQKDAACAHWAAHEAQFPDGTYAIEVSLAKRKLGCD